MPLKWHLGTFTQSNHYLPGYIRTIDVTRYFGALCESLEVDSGSTPPWGWQFQPHADRVVPQRPGSVLHSASLVLTRPQTMRQAKAFYRKHRYSGKWRRAKIKALKALKKKMPAPLGRAHVVPGTRLTCRVTARQICGQEQGFRASAGYDWPHMGQTTPEDGLCFCKTHNCTANVPQAEPKQTFTYFFL